VDYYFAPILGFDSGPVNSTATAASGPAIGVANPVPLRLMHAAVTACIQQPIGYAGPECAFGFDNTDQNSESASQWGVLDFPEGWPTAPPNPMACSSQPGGANDVIDYLSGVVGDFNPVLWALPDPVYVCAEGGMSASVINWIIDWLNAHAGTAFIFPVMAEPTVFPPVLSSGAQAYPIIGFVSLSVNGAWRGQQARQHCDFAAQNASSSASSLGTTVSTWLRGSLDRGPTTTSRRSGSSSSRRPPSARNNRGTQNGPRGFQGIVDSTQGPFAACPAAPRRVPFLDSGRRDQLRIRNTVPRIERMADRLFEGEEAVFHLMGTQIASWKRRKGWTSACSRLLPLLASERSRRISKTDSCRTWREPRRPQRYRLRDSLTPQTCDAHALAGSGWVYPIPAERPSVDCEASGMARKTRVPRPPGSRGCQMNTIASDSLTSGMLPSTEECPDHQEDCPEHQSPQREEQAPIPPEIDGSDNSIDQGSRKRQQNYIPCRRACLHPDPPRIISTARLWIPPVGTRADAIR